MTVYHNFSELARNETAGHDFVIDYRHTGSAIAILAPHGGRIEPGTTPIARALAGDEHNYYSFTGIKSQDNRDLHLTSNAFDEPQALATAARAEVAITIHGLNGSKPRVLIGGRNHQLQIAIRTSLTAAGFSAEISDVPGLRGASPTNICNRCISEKGVQLEISRGLREQLLAGLAQNGEGTPTAVFSVFIMALRKAIAPFMM